MLEKIANSTKGFVLVMMVGLLSAVFVLQFGGPQSQGCAGSGITPAARVYDAEISPTDLRSAFLLARDRFPADLARQYKMQEMVLRGLVEEQLLAREAEKVGFSVSEDEVIQRVAEDGIVYVAMSIDAGGMLPPAGPRRYAFTDADGNFSKDNLKGFIQNALRRSVRDFSRSQATATLAQRMRETVLSGVQVGQGEVWDAYVREQENVTLQYARFSPIYFGQKLEVTDEALGAYIADNQADVDAEYERQKHRYTGLEKQVRARHILVKSSESDDEGTRAAARKRIDGLLTQARKTGADFAALATEHSEDSGSAVKGGDLGFNAKGRMVKPFDEAQFAMEAGQISDVVESAFGFHIIKVEAVREGDVPVDEAKRELAEKLYRDSHAKDLASEAAAAALGQLKAGTAFDAITLVEGATPGDNDPLAPQVRDTRPFGRTDTPIPGPFDSSKLAQVAFDLTEEAPLPDAPIQLGDDHFVYRLQAKTVADREKFTEDEQRRITDGLLSRKRREALTAYVRGLMAQADAADAVSYDPTALEPAS